MSISLKFGAEVPGSEMQIRSVNMDFFYGSSFVREQPEAPRTSSTRLHAQ
jgi:glucose-6-phosphate 1-dehydrogenase